MVVCAIPKCQNTFEMGYSFYEISAKRRSALNWLKICNLPDSTSKYARICEGHFTRDQFEVDVITKKAKLKSTACPQILYPNPGRVLDQRTIATYKLHQTDLDGNCVYEISNVKKVKRLPELKTSLSCRDPLTNITNKIEKIDAKRPHSLSEEELQKQIQSLMAENQQLRNDKERLESIKDKNDVTIGGLEDQNNKLSLKVYKLEESKAQYLKNFSKLLNNDQASLLQLKDPSLNSRKWTPETVKKAIRVRLLAKARGYEELRRVEGWPLPSLSTINRKLQMLEFAPGLYHNILKLIGEKVTSEKSPHAKFAVLSLDEMSITPRIEFDKGLHCYAGFVSPDLGTVNNSYAVATHCMAFVVRGLTVHWKQLITYLLTGNSVSADKLGDYIDCLVRALHSHGIITVVVSSDMGGANQGVWSRKGVKCSRYKVDPAVQHPCPSEHAQELLYSPDVPHLVKNTWAQLLRRSIIMPEVWAQQHKTNFKKISASHVKKFMDRQGNSGVVLIPNLKPAALEPNRFEKMRVPIALSFFNKKLGNGIILMAEKGLIPEECAATGHFIVDFANWYDIMSSRQCFNGLSNDAKGKECVAFLKNFIAVMSQVVFVHEKQGIDIIDKQWKPIQSGIILATKVVLRLWERFVEPGVLKYVLTSRLFTSGCENLFSQLRGGAGDIHPTSVKIRHVLRLISVAQYLRCSSNAAYENDDEAYYVDFLDGKALNRSSDLVFHEEEIDEILDLSYEEFSEVARMGLYFLAGWVVSRLKGACTSCDSVILSPEALPHLPSDFTNAVSEGGLSHPTYMVWTVITYIEDIFNQKSKQILQRKNTKEFLIACSLKQTGVNFGVKCHNTHLLVAEKFLSLRLHILGLDVSKGVVTPTVVFNSTSAFMRTAAKNCRDASQPSYSKNCPQSTLPPPLLSNNTPAGKRKTTLKTELSKKRLLM